MPTEAGTACSVGLGMAFTFIQLVVQGLSHIIPTGGVVWCHAPIGAVDQLITFDGHQCWADDVFDGWWDAEGLHALQDGRIQLIPIRIVGLLVRNGPPLRLVFNFGHDVVEVFDRQRQLIQRYFAFIVVHHLSLHSPILWWGRLIPIGVAACAVNH